MDDHNQDSSNIMVWIRYVTIALLIVSGYYLYGYFIESKEVALRKQAAQTQGSSKLYGDIGGKFTLTDQHNNAFGPEQLQDKLTLLYFGFTFCPDICPESLGKLSEVKSTLNKYNIPIQIVFVSVDPKRDTPEALKEYLTGIYEGIIGLTGNSDKIKKVADQYKVYYAVSAQTKNDPKDYLLDHSSFTYLLNRDGDVVKHFSFSEPARNIIEYIRINYK